MSAHPSSAHATAALDTLHIDGVWQAAASGATREVLDPADATVLALVSEGGTEDTDAAVAAARRAFDDGPWPHRPVGERAELLRRVAGLLQRDREEIAIIESRDTGKTLEEGRVDVDDVTNAFRYFADLVMNESGGRVVDAGDPDVHSVVVHEPVGVCALIAPWNYPLLQASWKIAPALAAGNTFVLKPSEVTPLSTVHLIRLLAEAGLPDGVANLVTGAATLSVPGSPSTRTSTSSPSPADSPAVRRSPRPPHPPSRRSPWSSAARTPTSCSPTPAPPTTASTPPSTRP